MKQEAVLPAETYEILEIVAAKPRLPWWEIHRWHKDVYGGSTRPTAFRQELGSLESFGLLQQVQSDAFELTEQGRAARVH